MSQIIIVGGGLAGATTATELRAQGYDGDITLIGAEAEAPYERPPLSKDLLLGKAGEEKAFVHDREWYAENNIDLLTDTTVTAIDPAARQVTLDDGRRLSYDQLVLATGARSRHLAMADESGAPILYLRTLDESRRIKDHLTDHLLIIGAGWIGLEVAAAAREAGGQVTIVENADLPLGRILGPEVAPVFADLHRAHGVDLRLNAAVDSITHDDGTTTVRLSGGEEIHPDVILVAIGAEPNDSLAADAGLATNRGVLVDEALRTSDPNVYAIGDVANHDHPRLGRIRVEHWDTAIQHGRHVAKNLVGQPVAYEREPYFFTDQYDLGMEYVGHTGQGGYDDVIIRGDLGSRLFNVLWLHEGRVVAGMHVNDWDATKSLRAWVGQPATDALRDTTIPLADISH